MTGRVVRSDMAVRETAMKPTTGRAAALAVWLVLAGGQALAADTTADTSGQIYGSQLMTRQERNGHRACGRVIR